VTKCVQLNVRGEVVVRYSVCQVDDGELQTPFVLIAVKYTGSETILSAEPSGTMGVRSGSPTLLYTPVASRSGFQ